MTIVVEDIADDLRPRAISQVHTVSRCMRAAARMLVVVEKVACNQDVGGAGDMAAVALRPLELFCIEKIVHADRTGSPAGDFHVGDFHADARVERNTALIDRLVSLRRSLESE